MEGTVTLFDKETHLGKIQCDDGRIADFDKSALAPALHYSDVRVGLRVSFSEEEGRLSHILPLSKQDLIEGEMFYLEPSEIGIAKDAIPEGYELLDKGERMLNLEAKTSKALKLKFIDICRKLQGNVVLDYSEEEFSRNSIGFSISMVRGSATFGVMGRKADENTEGACSLYDLKHKLRHETLLKLHGDEEKGKIGLKIIKYSGFILLLLFTYGFFKSL